MRYLFANCLLDTKSREFRRGSTEVHLSPKAHELLHLLIAQRPRVVSKAELMQALWPDTFVVEGNLPVLVADHGRRGGGDARRPRQQERHQGQRDTDRRGRRTAGRRRVDVRAGVGAIPD